MSYSEKCNSFVSQAVDQPVVHPSFGYSWRKYLPSYPYSAGAPAPDGCNLSCGRETYLWKNLFITTSPKISTTSTPGYPSWISSRWVHPVLARLIPASTGSSYSSQPNERSMAFCQPRISFARWASSIVDSYVRATPQFWRRSSRFL